MSVEIIPLSQVIYGLRWANAAQVSRLRALDKEVRRLRLERRALREKLEALDRAADLERTEAAA